MGRRRIAEIDFAVIGAHEGDVGLAHLDRTHLDPQAEERQRIDCQARRRHLGDDGLLAVGDLDIVDLQDKAQHRIEIDDRPPDRNAVAWPDRPLKRGRNPVSDDAEFGRPHQNNRDHARR